MSLDLVTGGAGFIGSHVVRRLLAEGRQVRVVDDLSTGKLDRLRDVTDRIDLVTEDLARADLAPVTRGVERVFHLAAVPSVPRSVRDPLTTHGSVATATLRLLIASREAGVRGFVSSSSSSVYGESEASPKHESLPTRPLSPYGAAKLVAEHYVEQFARLYGLRTVSLRYFNVFGPRQDPMSSYAAVIPRFITLALRGDPVTVYGDGTQTRDFTFVDDVVEANVVAAAAAEHASAGAVYNIAGGQPHSVQELIGTIEELLGRELAVTYAPPRPGDIKHSCADIGRARRELSWSPKVSFGEGLRRTLEWFRVG